eukprot:961171-Alexandrium_andersonii.AAC.1
MFGTGAQPLDASSRNALVSCVAVHIHRTPSSTTSSATACGRSRATCFAARSCVAPHGLHQEDIALGSIRMHV